MASTSLKLLFYLVHGHMALTSKLCRPCFVALPNHNYIFPITLWWYTHVVGFVRRALHLSQESWCGESNFCGKLKIKVKLQQGAFLCCWGVIKGCRSYRGSAILNSSSWKVVWLIKSRKEKCPFHMRMSLFQCYPIFQQRLTLLSS